MKQDSLKQLSKLVVHIFTCPANSVASERAFSAQNFLHNKVRNALQTVRVDKLIFIYINQRALRQMQGKQNIELGDSSLLTSGVNSIYNLIEEEEVELEDMILEDKELIGTDKEFNELEEDLEIE